MKKCLMLVVLPFMLAAMPHAHGADEETCLKRSVMIDTLITQYGEQLAEVHEIKGKGLLEFHVSPTSGTWTALLTDNDGVSCVLGAGDGIDPSKSKVLQAGYSI